MRLERILIMINEERVKNLYKIALYEQREEKYQRQTGQYYKSDYISKEIIKSFFVGTIAYGVMLVLWAISSIESFLESINNLEIIKTTVGVVLIYIGFMSLYLFATYIISVTRYKNGKARLKDYMTALKATRKMYEREEKLKM